MEISEIWPRSEVTDRIDGKLSILELNDFEKISKRKRGSCHEIGGFIWDQYVSSEESLHEPMHLAKHFKSGNPGLLRAIEKLLNSTLLHEIYYVKAEITDGSLDYRVASELLVARIWPNNIHISDVEFSNPYRPIPKGSGIPFQKCKGLGLLPILLEKTEVYARFKGLSTLSLTAATRPHYDLFSRHGFNLAETRAGELSLEYGQGIPMLKRI